jgi:hypothetical protein
MLIHFISDLLRNPQSQSAFTRDPGLAMSAAGLSEVAKAAVLSRDRATIASALHMELEAIDTSRVIFWPAPKVTVQSVQPGQGRRGTSVELTVTGLWFDVTATCQLVLGDLKIDGKVLSVSGEENTVLKASFELSASAWPGSYGVRVANSAENSDMLPNAFSVEE